MSFDVFTSPSHAERVVDAVVALLAADPEITSWATAPGGATNILRMADPLILPDRPRPFIAVSPSAEGRLNQPSREAEVELAVSVWLIYDEYRDAVEAGARTIAAAANRVIRVLMGDPLLDEISGTKLADTISRIDRLPYDPIQSDDGVSLVLELRVTYRYTIDAVTGAVA